ncbi:MAG: TlpA family protein disulfide reductase [Blastochloris sp.]|nr:TlpA family protein disulfide reductase [Blastochloris sp.]
MIRLDGTPQQWALVGLVLLLTAGGFWFVRSGDGFGRASAEIRVGVRAPAISLETLDGRQVSLAEQRGKVVIVNLWASWCGPCRAEMPALQALYRAEQARGLEIFAVNSTMQDSPQAAQAFVAEHGLTFPILLDTEGVVGEDYRLRSLPSTFIVDRQGIIQAIFFGGPLPEATLSAAVTPLLDAE